MEYIDNSL